MVQEFYSYSEMPNMAYDCIETAKIFIGCCIKNKYDEERIKINDSFNPYRISHSNQNFYGVIFEPTGKYIDFVENLKQYDDLDLISYGSILKKNNLSCEENFAYLNDGLYPLDRKYIQDYISNFKYNDFFVDEEEAPIYQRIKAINMFILIPDFERCSGSK
jgi:hypothetical protein